MDHMLNDNTVNEKLKNAGADLEEAATALGEVLTALAAIMPCLPGAAPLKAEHGKIEKAAKGVKAASVRIGGIRERLPDDALRNRKVIDREDP